ncbi:DUF6745 domain-containing protein [Nonomuraea jabiensis]|uniref:DUF6745 domain-containing protein n=1 Tax=Nonomuraea jabiensis TaxID=882448 RepID=A0A7W9LBG4_9ACTN|nr:hypothetical protein [Nonomuraea jabiensis]MBB5777702.1 hypothetical protein [Nonomuraea jabiensis]
MTTLTWERVAMATGPGEDPETAVRQAYREAGLAEPEHVLVLPSPAAGAVAAAWLTGGDAVRRALEQAGLGALPDRSPSHGGSPTGSPRHGDSPTGSPSGDGSPTGSASGSGSEAQEPGDRGVPELRRAVGEALRSWESYGDPGRSVRDAVRTVPWERARTAAYAELGPVGWAALWDETGGRLWPQVNRLVNDIRRGIADLGGDAGEAVKVGEVGKVGEAGKVAEASEASEASEVGEVGEVLRRATLDAVLGQHDAPWLSAFDGLDGLKRTAERTGWWWPFERLAIVTERPAELHLDEVGRLHRAVGPALAYSDGFALHAWHGMPVPAGFGAAMRELTVERIREEENAELRRAMLEHFGLDRYLAESGAKPVHSDETGVLWRVDLSDDEPLVMVEVVNSTPEPDGTSRTYFLRVPPWVERAREGVAWTFGVAEEDYRPERET